MLNIKNFELNALEIFDNVIYHGFFQLSVRSFGDIMKEEERCNVAWCERPMRLEGCNVQF